MRVKKSAITTAVTAAAAVLLMLPTSPAAAAPSLRVPTGQEVFIDHVQTGEHLTPNGFNKNPEFYVDIWEDHNGVVAPTETWIYDRVDDTTFRIRNAGGNNVCLQPQSVENRKYVNTKTCSTTSRAQRWRLYETTTGTRDGFTIRPVLDPDLAITPNSVPSHNDQAVLLSPVGDYLNQVFRNRLA